MHIIDMNGSSSPVNLQIEELQTPPFWLPEINRLQPATASSKLCLSANIIAKEGKESVLSIKLWFTQKERLTSLLTGNS